MKALAILFGAGLTVATAFSLGVILFRRLRLNLHRSEERLLAFVTGSACLSEIILVLCATHTAYKGVFLGVAIASFIGAWMGRRPSTEQVEPACLPRLWRYLFLSIFGAFTVIYFLNAMAPEMSPDGTAYHLAVVDHYQRAHGFERVPTNFLFNISQGVEMLFLMAFEFGKHSAAALVHFAFLAVLPWMVLAYGRRFGMPLAGAAAGLIVYASPVFGVDGSSAYVDVGLAAVIFAMFYLLQVWDEQRDDRLLVPVAILAGFAFAVKYTALLAAIYALGFVVWRLREEVRFQTILRRAGAMAAIVALFAAPWPVKSWMWVGNPLSPFGNRMFPNPWVHVSFEQDYRRQLETYRLKSQREVPWQVTMQGEVLSGFLGPWFLLTPLGMLALRWKQGRRVMLAGLIFALPFASNIGTRFLIPAAPFLALCLAMALAQWRWLLFGITVVHAVLSWPNVASLYCGPAAWRLPTGLPLRPALRLESEDSFLRRRWSGYVVDRLIEEKVPKGEPVFLFGATAESYTSRRMLVSYLSAPNQTLRDILLTPLVRDYQASVVLDFRFPRRRVRRLRAVETRTAAGEEMWSISELQVFVDGKEVERAPQWRLTARPNPYEIQLAFDNSLVTRWRGWQPAAAGDYVEIDFGQEQPLDRVTIASSVEYTNKQVRLETQDAQGKWSRVGGTMQESPGSTEVNLRAAATAELKARGVRYLVVYSEDLGADDFRGHADYWGLKRLGEAEGSSIYRIE